MNNSLEYVVLQQNCAILLNIIGTNKETNKFETVELYIVI